MFFKTNLLQFPFVILLIKFFSFASFKKATNPNEVVYVWDLNKGTLKYQLVGHSSNVLCLAALDNGLLASGGYDARIKIWNMTTGELKYDLDESDHSAYIHLLVKLEQNLLATGSNKGVTVWNVTDGRKEFNLVMGLINGLVLDMTLLPKNLLAVSLDALGEAHIRIYNLNTRLLKFSLKSSLGNYLMASDRRDLLISAGFSIDNPDEKTLKVYNITTGKLKYTLDTGSSFSSLTPLSSILIGQTFDDEVNMFSGRIYGWNLSTGQMNFNLSGNSTDTGEIQSLDSSRVAIKTGNNSIKILNVETGEIIFKLKEISYRIDQYEFNIPAMAKSMCVLDKSFLASSANMSVNIWDTIKGELKFILKSDLKNTLSLARLDNGLLAGAHGLLPK